MALLSVAEALARVLDGVRPTSAEDVPLLAGAGRVLAADVAAKLTQPPFDVSAMDGYAVRANDVAELPATLTLIGESAAGRGFTGTVGRGQAVRIFTGAEVPGGADAIAIQENTTVEGTAVIVRDGAAGFRHIRAKGQDFTADEVLLRAGNVLIPRTLALAAAMGHATLPVRVKPRVAILATGDELVEPGATPGPDQIVSSNPFGLAAMVSAAGGAPELIGIARDTRESLSAKVAEAAEADILVTVGGASVGTHDLVRPVLEARGMALDFWKIAMRPGKPMLFGRLAGQRVLGLPGNPVSCLVTARVFLVPLIHRLLGRVAPAECAVTAVLGAPLGANGPRAHYMRAAIADGAGGLPYVTALASQDSSRLADLARANALIVREPSAPALPAGAEVRVLPLDF